MMKIIDVAAYFLSRESMTHKKLQKMCYYAQGWSLVLFDKPITDVNFEAWVHGPVNFELYDLYKSYGFNKIPMTNLTSANHDSELVSFLDLIYNSFNVFSGDELEEITQNEKPWKFARGNLQPWETSRTIISNVLLREFYVELYEDTKLTNGLTLPVNTLWKENLSEPIEFSYTLLDLSHEKFDFCGICKNWFNDFFTEMKEVSGMTKFELSFRGYSHFYKSDTHNWDELDLKLQFENIEQYERRQIQLGKSKSVIHGVFIGNVFYIVWIAPYQNLDSNEEQDDVNKSSSIESGNNISKAKLYELQKENDDLKNRNKELWELFDELTDPKDRLHLH